MPSRNTIEIVINAQDNASDILKGVVGGIQGIGDVALNIVGAGLAAGAAAVTGFAVASLDSFKNFEDGISEVFTLLPGITEDAMKQMEEDVQSFMQQTGRLSSEAIPALYQALSAGVPKDNVFTFLEIANKAAVGGASDLETAVNGITSAVNAYGAEVLSAGEASDIMFTAVRLGKTTFGELSASMFQVTTVAAGMGVAFSDVLAGVATLTSQGVPTSVAMTQIRQALLEMNDAGTEIGKKFTELAGTSFADFIAQGHTLAEAFQILADEAERSGIPIEQMFGSVEAGQAALALTGANMDTFTNNINEMGNAAGATDAAFATMNQTMGASMGRLAARWESFMISMGRVIEPFVTPAIEAFSTLLGIFTSAMAGGGPMEALSSWLGDIPMWMRPFALLAAELGTQFAIVVQEFNAFIAVVQAGLDPMTAFITMISNIAGPEVAQAFESIIEAVTGFFSAIQEVLQPVIDWVLANVELQDVLLALGIAIASVVIPAVLSFFAAFAPLAALIVAIAALRLAWENDFMGMRTAITDAWTEMQPILTEIGEFFTGLWDALQTGGIEGAATFLQDNLINPIMEQITSTDWGAVATSVGEALGNAFLTLIDWGVWVLDNVLIPLKDTAVSVVESVDWFMVGASIVTAIGNVLKTTFDFVAWIIDSIFNPAVEGSEDAAGQIDWQAIGDAIMGGIAWAMLTYIDYILWLVDTVFKPLIAGASSAIAATDWGEVGQGLMDAIAGALPDIATWVANNIIVPIQNSLAGFNPMSGINTGGAIGAPATGGGFNFGQAVGGLFGVGAGNAIGSLFGGNQFGGRVTAGTPTIVGEGGRELFVPDSDGEIMNNRDTEMLGGGAGGKIQIVFNFHRGISDQEAQDSAYKLTRELRAQGINV